MFRHVVVIACRASVGLLIERFHGDSFFSLSQTEFIGLGKELCWAECQCHKDIVAQHQLTSAELELLVKEQSSCVMA